MKEALKAILSNKDNKDGMHIQSIVDTLIMSYPEIQGELTREKLLNKVNTFLLKESKDKKGEFAKVTNPKTKKEKKGVYRFVVRKRSKPLPKPEAHQEAEDPEETHCTKKKETNFFGKAGEYAVMSELLFRDYNANNMAVDEGIDIVASKDNNFYFIQVKTITLKPNRTASTKITQKNFDKFINQQIRYVIAVKCEKEMRFFTLSNDTIAQLHHSKAIKVSQSTGDIHIKIKYDNATGEPYFYDESEMNASFWEGFDRIEATPLLKH